MKILVVSYSQTGQLEQILEKFLEPFSENEVDWVKLEADPAFPFPWPTNDFFNAMPETVLEEPIKLMPYEFKSLTYDLIVLGYQPWFLSPSLPISTVLQHEEFQKRLKDTPVITISGGRNMWLSAQESVKKYIKQAGGRLVGNIPLVDRNANLVSVITIVHWLVGGKKDRKWGIFPMPGISPEDIDFVDQYGKVTLAAFSSGNLTGLQDQLRSFGRIKVPTDILFIEGKGKRIFKIWAGVIKKKGTKVAKRSRLVSIFKYYLLTALFVVSPILLLFYYLIVWPFTQKQLLKKKEYFCRVEA